MTPDPVFLMVAAAAVASPGPGVVLTLTNAIRYGAAATFGGILGLACGAFTVAALSAAGLGVVLKTSALAFTVMKLVGACYLAYLGLRLWTAPPLRVDTSGEGDGSPRRRFLEAISVQVTNPKALAFFLSVFPQFIAPGADFVPQFVLLVLSYAALILTIHSVYALTARRTRHWLATERGGRAVNRLGGATFFCFGALLAGSRR